MIFYKLLDALQKLWRHTQHSTKFWLLQFTGISKIIIAIIHYINHNDSKAIIHTVIN